MDKDYRDYIGKCNYRTPEFCEHPKKQGIEESIMDLNWKNFEMLGGKHKGWSMWQIYHCDYSYISEFLIPKCDDQEVLAAAQAAVAHKERVDPWNQK